jgi:hypothetical protein
MNGWQGSTSSVSVMKNWNLKLMKVALTGEVSISYQYLEIV